MMSASLVGKVFRRSLVVLLFFFSLPMWSHATQPPLQLIETGTDRVLKILHSAQSGTGPSIRQRKPEILAIVDEYFDFGEMGKHALGRPWKDQSPQAQQEFVKLFKQLLFNTYVDRVDAYTDANERVVYDKEEVDGEYSLVKTRVTGYKNTDVQVDYRLRLLNGQWKVYDVIVEGVSLVNNYRSQFSSILANGSFDSLLKTMQEKVSEQ